MIIKLIAQDESTKQWQDKTVSMQHVPSVGEKLEFGIMGEVCTVSKVITRLVENDTGSVAISGLKETGVFVYIREAS